MKRADPLADVNLLALAPVRVASSEERDGRVVVERPRPSGRGLRHLLELLAHAMSTRRIRLDAVGSFAWKRLDGSLTVGDLAAALRAEFGDAVEPAEERTGSLMRLLRRERLIAYPGWDEARERR